VPLISVGSQVSAFAEPVAWNEKDLEILDLWVEGPKFYSNSQLPNYLRGLACIEKVE
jgi:hypothetical protein